MNELYVTGVVIANGVADHEGDILDKTDIKKIFTKYIEKSTDTMHTKIKNKGVEVLANWISETDKNFNGKIAPAGSWLATLKIENEEIIKAIQDGNIKGFSLGSIPDFALTQKYWFINKSINYRDLDDTEEVIPLFISLVDLPSNGYDLIVDDYDIYINKRADIMTEEKIESETVSMGTLEKIANILNINKSVDGEVMSATDVEITKADEPATDDITNKELLEQISDKVTEGVVNAFEKLPEILEKVEEATADEEVIEKAEDEEKPAKDTEEEEEEEDKKEKEDVEINKRQSTKTENINTNPNKSTNFYKLSGRDAFGCRK